MIRLKLKIDAKGQEITRDAFAGSLESNILFLGGQVDLRDAIDKSFHVVLNGEIHTRADWDVYVTNDDDIFICPRLMGGGNDPNALLRLVIIATAVALSGGAASALVAKLQLTSSFAVGVTTALVTAAGSSIGVALAFQAFPPPTITLGGNAPGEAGGSQTYSLSSQSNRPNSYGFVPKVYGRHKMVPYVAANPYITLEPDATGRLVQWLHAVYDFGFGPNVVTDIKIGNTNITNFQDLFFQLVDFNRPLIDEGFWDNDLKNSLSYYTGVRSVEPVSVTLDRNEVDAPSSVSSYQVTRRTASNPDNERTKISVQLVFARGLRSVASNGASGSATVNFKLEFANVLTPNTWIRVDAPGAPGVTNYRVVQKQQAIALEQPFTSALGMDAGIFRRQINFNNQIVQGNQIRYKTETIFLISNYIPNRFFVFSYTDLVFDFNYILKIGVAGQSLGRLIGKQAQFVIDGRMVYRYEIDLQGRPLPNTTMAIRVIDNSKDLNVEANWEKQINFPPVFFVKEGGGNLSISDNSLEPVYAQVEFEPTQAGEFFVRLTRQSTNNFYNSGALNTGLSDTSVLSLTTEFFRPPIVTTKRHTFLEVKIRATNQLNGTIQNLSAEVSSVLDVWNGSAWVKQETNNPAWVATDILTGQINRRALNKNRLDTASFLAWAQFCDQVPVSVTSLTYTQKRFESNFIFDFNSTVHQLFEQVATSCQASLNLIDGKYGVLIDRQKTIPTQVFTPKNSSGFSSVKSFTRNFDALRVRFVEQVSDYEPVEITVFQDGFTSANAEEYDEITAFGATNFEQAFRFAKYQLAQNKLRKEIFSIEVDFEYLICQRGDYVRIAQDVARVGGVAARVKTVAGNIITINEGITTDPLLNYGYTARGYTGIIEGTIVDTISSDEFELSGPIPSVGDLIVIGEVTRIYYDCIVKAIEPSNGEKATLTLIEKADPIYTAETNAVTPDYNPGIAPVLFGEQIAPPEVVNLQVLENIWRCNGGQYEYYVDLQWEAPVGAAFDIFEIYVNDGQGFDLYNFTNSTTYRVVIDQRFLNIEHSFKVLAVSATGVKLDLGDVTAVSATPLRKITPPSNVSTLGIDITDEILQLSWNPVSDCDVSDYLIRYSPDVNGLWNSTVPLLRVGRDTTLASVQARTGVYLIKAVDWNGNESVLPARAVTTIPNLFNLNIIEETTDFPDLNGSFDTISKLGNALLISESVSGAPELTQYFSEGFYYFENLLQLGEIYTVRLQALITAEGYTPFDMMINWTNLSDIANLGTTGSSDWDVELQYRTTDSFITMSTWTTLASVETLTLGTPELWSPWRKITAITDATGKIFQFRLRLLSFNPSVTPRVFDAVIRADMPDRTLNINNLLVPSGGSTVIYNPGFYGPVANGPNIQVTIDDASAGDYWLISNRSVDSFDIQFFNIDGDPVSRIADFQVRGYGYKGTVVI